MDFVSLGMFIIDDIYYPVPRAPVTDIIGGAGSYAVLGARIMKGSGHGIGWTVHTGSDFPEKVREEIESWGTDCNTVDTPERLTTRGLNVYGQNEKRDFEYGGSKIRIDHENLTEAQLGAKVFHFICSPLRCIDLVNGIHEKRRQLFAKANTAPCAVEDPIFVWEPVPDVCKPSELPNCKEALKYVDVMSPNFVELESFLGTKLTKDAGRTDTEELNGQCLELLQPQSGSKVRAIVVRMGELGARVITREGWTSIDAYHRPSSANSVEEGRLTSRTKIVDPTGAGNAFLGGFCIGLLNDRSVPTLTYFEKAAMYGSVAASFAVEQVGTPILTPSQPGGTERWNKEIVQDRLKSYNRATLNHPLIGER